MDPTYPLFPIMAFLGFVLPLLPLRLHLQAWNAGTCMYIFWASTACLMLFVNTILWKDTMINFAPVWCDISSKFLLGAGVGIPASSLCIIRRLYHITAVQTVSFTKRDKQRALTGDVCIGIGVPILVMALHYIVQGHRFDILENIGCCPTIYLTIWTFPLVYMWPPLLGCISFVYSGLTLYAFWKRRVQFKELLASVPLLSVHRYLRLIILACTEMACTIPISIYSTYCAVHGVPVAPYISWSDTHYNFSRVDQIPAFEWRANSTVRTSMELTIWLYPSCSFLFFVLFGLAGEARKSYYGIWVVIAQRLRLKTSKDKRHSIPSWKQEIRLSRPKLYRPSIDMRPPSSASTDLSTSHDVEKSAGLRSSTVYFSSSESAESETTSITPRSSMADQDTPAVSSAPISDYLVDARRTVLPRDIPIEPAQLEQEQDPTGLYHPPSAQETQSALAYHRPFSSPAAYPLAKPHRSAQPGRETVDEIPMVTMHSQVSSWRLPALRKESN